MGTDLHGLALNWRRGVIVYSLFVIIDMYNGLIALPSNVTPVHMGGLSIIAIKFNYDQ